MAKAKDTAKTFKELEAQSREIAQKIWFAGLGAYGKAYAEAAQNAQKINAGTSELFEDLVQRGTEIDGDMKDRIASFDQVQKATERFSQVTETATRLQREQREAFDARMQRMRTVLGFGTTDKKADELNTKLDKLEDEIASLSAQAKPRKGAAVSKDVAERLSRLSAEIDAIAGAKAPAKPKAKAAPRKRAATAAKKPAARKTAAKKRTTKAKA